MDFKRKAYGQLVEWKEKSGHKPLIVEGLRQVGKSYIVAKFAEENYENSIILDFRHRKELRLCFKGNLDVDQIIAMLEPYVPEKKFVPGKTCLVFEEIGDCAEARTSLKSFCLDARYEVIATGSLLGVDNYRRKSKLPVPTGYEEHLKMASMDFEEFLWAMGAPESAIASLKKAALKAEELPPALANYFSEAIRQYMIVGGMPDAVKAFLESNRNYLQARSVQEELIKDYRADFGRFVDEDGNERIDYDLQAKLNQIFDAIPSQLSRENDVGRFKLSEVSKKARYSQYVNVFDWLEKAGLVLLTHNLKAIESPLQGNAEPNSFKAFVSDPGLLMSLFPLATLQDFLLNRLGSRKGALYENMLASMIDKAGFPLFYYGNYEKHLEIDFLLEGKEGIILLEEKSTNGKMAASRSVMEGDSPFKASRCIKINSFGVGKGSFYTSYPQYMAPFVLAEEMERLKEGLIAPPLSLFSLL